MRPHKHILLVCCDEFRSAELLFAIETRISAEVIIASGMAIPVAVKAHDFHCAVLTHSDKEVIDFLRAREIPTLEIGNPSSADRCISGSSMAEILEAVKILCTRKRGPKARRAA